jgi:hypothetical protein
MAAGRYAIALEDEATERQTSQLKQGSELPLG